MTAERPVANCEVAAKRVLFVLGRQAEQDIRNAPCLQGLAHGRVHIQTGGMDKNTEEANLHRVVERVAERYPTVDRDRVESVVDDEVHQLDDANVRDYIPVLVEHQVVERLRDEADPVSLADRLAADVDRQGDSSATLSEQG